MDTNNQTTLPFSLGATVQEVRSFLGEPTKKRTSLGKDIEIHAERGLVISFRDDSLVEISGSCVTIDDTSFKFEGKICGISFLDSIHDHLPRLGPPIKRRDFSYGKSELIWAVNDFYLVVEIVSEGEEDEEFEDMVYRAGGVCDVTIKTAIMTEEEEYEASMGLIQEMYPGVSLDTIKENMPQPDQTPKKPWWRFW